MILKGCWEIRKDKPCMVVYRNELLHENDRHFETVIPVVWEDAPTPDGQFYELEAEVRDGGFFVVTAQGPFEPPPNVQVFEKKVCEAEDKEKAGEGQKGAVAIDGNEKGDGGGKRKSLLDGVKMR
jgi:hypothetical protein